MRIAILCRGCDKLGGIKLNNQCDFRSRKLKRENNEFVNENENENENIAVSAHYYYSRPNISIEEAAHGLWRQTVPRPHGSHRKRAG